MLDNTATFEEMSERCQTIDNAASNLTGLKFESQTPRPRDQRVSVLTTCPDDHIIAFTTYRERVTRVKPLRIVFTRCCYFPTF